MDAQPGKVEHYPLAGRLGFYKQRIVLIHGQPMSRLAVVIFLLWSHATILTGVLRAQDEPSLAERAEALRKKAQSEATPTVSPTPSVSATATPAKTVPALVATPKPTVYLRPSPVMTPAPRTIPQTIPQTTPQATPIIRNTIQQKDYRNDSIGLEIKCLDNWSVVDPDKLTTNKAVTIGKFRVQSAAEIARDPKNVYAIRDAAGSTVVLTLVQFQPDDPLPINLRSDIQRAIGTDDPGMRLSQEALSLDDADHHFAAFRAADLRGVRFESVQAMVFQGYLVQISVGSASQDRLSAILKDLKTHISWNQTH